MGFEPLKRILRQTATTTPIAKDLQIARVFDCWQRTLVALWGDARANYVSPVSFREGVLKVETISPAAKQQLSTDLMRLKNDVNRQLGELVVRSITVLSKGF